MVSIFELKIKMAAAKTTIKVWYRLQVKNWVLLVILFR